MSLDIHTSSPESIFEKDIKVPWDSDLPFKVRMFLKKENKDDPDESMPVSGHNILFQIFSVRPDNFIPEAILEFTNSKWEKTAHPDVAYYDQLERVFEWEELDVLSPGFEYFYRMHGTDPEGIKYTIMQGAFVKGGG